MYINGVATTTTTDTRTMVRRRQLNHPSRKQSLPSLPRDFIPPILRIRRHIRHVLLSRSTNDGRLSNPPSPRERKRCSLFSLCASPFRVRHYLHITNPSSPQPDKQLLRRRQTNRPRHSLRHPPPKHKIQHPRPPRPRHPTPPLNLPNHPHRLG